MCHNFNYSDEHRGHRVVSLPEAYKIIKKQSIQNLNLLDRMLNLVNYRIRYTTQCRHDIENDLKRWEAEITEYTGKSLYNSIIDKSNIDQLINELYLLRHQKIELLRAEHERRDKYMVENYDALVRLSDEIKLLI